MNVADELRKLQELHQSGALNAAEFAAAKAKVLSESSAAPAPDPTMQQHLAEIKRHNDVAQLDRQWAMERDGYMIAGNRGIRQLPTKGMSVLAGVAITAFGIVWIAMASSITAGIGGGASLFPMFGLVFIALGIGVSIYSFNKASQYEVAHARYRRRRAELLADNRDNEGGYADKRIQGGHSDERIQE